ncbi:MAG: hypothetical protein QF704_07315 [Anaerolineales bacterium]|nr:hypothetical protein [Anaerolineales bacterium]
MSLVLVDIWRVEIASKLAQMATGRIQMGLGLFVMHVIVGARLVLGPAKKNVIVVTMAHIGRQEITNAKIANLLVKTALDKTIFSAIHASKDTG